MSTVGQWVGAGIHATEELECSCGGGKVRGSSQYTGAAWANVWRREQTRPEPLLQYQHCPEREGQSRFECVDEPLLP